MPRMTWQKAGGAAGAPPRRHEPVVASPGSDCRRSRGAGMSGAADGEVAEPWTPAMSDGPRSSGSSACSASGPGACGARPSAIGEGRIVVAAGSSAVRRARRELPARSRALRRQVRGAAGCRGVCHAEGPAGGRPRHQCRLHQGRPGRQPAGPPCHREGPGPVRRVLAAPVGRPPLLRADLGVHARRPADHQPARPQGQEDPHRHARGRDAAHRQPVAEGQRHRQDQRHPDCREPSGRRGPAARRPRRRGVPDRAPGFEADPGPPARAEHPAHGFLRRGGSLRQPLPGDHQGGAAQGRGGVQPGHSLRRTSRCSPRPSSSWCARTCTRRW